MKTLALILALTATVACAQQATRKSKAATPDPAMAKLYAADPGWRALTNDLARISKEVAGLRDQRQKQLEKLKTTRRTRNTQAIESEEQALAAIKEKAKEADGRLATTELKKTEYEEALALKHKVGRL